MAFGDVLGAGDGANSTSPGTSLVGAGLTVAAGDLVVVAINTKGSAVQFAGIACADNLGNTWTNLYSLSTNGNSATLSAWYCVIPSGKSGSCTITVSWTASQTGDAALSIARFEGPFASSPRDILATETSDSTTPYACPATGTLAQADELVVGFGANSNGITATDFGQTGLIARQDRSGTGSNTAGILITALVVSSTGTVTLTYSASASTTGRQGTVTFKHDDAQLLEYYRPAGRVGANLMQQLLAT